MIRRVGGYRRWTPRSASRSTVQTVRNSSRRYCSYTVLSQADCAISLRPILLSRVRYRYHCRPTPSCLSLPALHHQQYQLLRSRPLKLVQGTFGRLLKRQMIRNPELFKVVSSLAWPLFRHFSDDRLTDTLRAASSVREPLCWQPYWRCEY